MTTPQATTAANIALARSTLDAFNAGDIDTCVARMAPDFVMNLAGLPPMPGPEVWRQGVGVIKSAFPDLHAHIDDVVAEGDQVALRLTFRGTHQGNYLGIPATGRTVEYVSHEFYRIADGRFAEEWICSDMATLHSQLTAATPEPAATWPITPLGLSTEIPQPGPVRAHLGAKRASGYAVKRVTDPRGRISTRSLVSWACCSQTRRGPPRRTGIYRSIPVP